MGTGVVALFILDAASGRQLLPPVARAEAGEGSRTLVDSLEGYRSTVELHPHRSELYIYLPISKPQFNQSENGE